MCVFCSNEILDTRLALVTGVQTCALPIYFRRSSPFVSCNVLGTPRKTAGAGLSDERQGKSCAPPDAHFCHRIVIETGLKAEITHLHRCSREAFEGPAQGSTRCFPPQLSRPELPRRRPAEQGHESTRPSGQRLGVVRRE